MTESETETPKKFPRLSLETEKKPRPSQALIGGSTFLIINYIQKYGPVDLIGQNF